MAICFARSKRKFKKIDDCRWKSKTSKNASWIDAFLFGDIYCLGFGFGLCEFDLWWLLNRKAREKGNAGKMFFYDPASVGAFDTKLDLFKLLKSEGKNSIVEHISLGFEKAKMQNSDFQSFYILALEDIKQRMRTK